MGYNPEINDVIEYDMKDKSGIQQGGRKFPKPQNVISGFSVQCQQPAVIVPYYKYQ